MDPCFRFFRITKLKKCRIFLFWVIFRSWPFNKKYSAMKDLLKVIQYDYVQIFYLFCLPTSYDVIMFCMWHVYGSPCILKTQYFLKNCSVHKEKPNVYNLDMFGKNLFVVTINYDFIGIQTTESSRKGDRTVFKTVSPIDDFETINGSTLVARLLQ